MEIIYQEVFRPVSQSGRNDRLVIHRRAKGDDRALIIFVHGFGGNWYTTWGKFPQFLFADFLKERRPELGLGLYGHCQLKTLRDILSWKAAGLALA